MQRQSKGILPGRLEYSDSTISPNVDINNVAMTAEIYIPKVDATTDIEHPTNTFFHSSPLIDA
jgi:hypothetical protein